MNILLTTYHFTTKCLSRGLTSTDAGAQLREVGTFCYHRQSRMLVIARGAGSQTSKRRKNSNEDDTCAGVRQQLDHQTATNAAGGVQERCRRLRHISKAIWVMVHTMVPDGPAARSRSRHLRCCRMTLSNPST